MVKDCDREFEDNDSKDDKTITAVGILSTIDSILNVMEEKADVCLFNYHHIFKSRKTFNFQILNSLENIVLPVIYAIAHNGMMGKNSSHMVLKSFFEVFL